MKTVLVIREYDDFSRILAENNFEIINLPLIETVTLDDLSDFEAKLARIENYDGVFLTSGKAAEIFGAKSVEKSLKYSGKVYVLGSRSYKLLKTKNFDLVFNETANTAREMLENIAPKDLKNKRFLFVRGEKSLRVAPEFLEKVATVEEAVVYRTEKLAIEIDKKNELREKFESGEITTTCFFSPSQAEAFLEQFGTEITHQTLIAAIGKTTAEYFERRNLTVDFVSSKSNAEIFAIELVNYLKKNLPAKHAKDARKRETQ